MTPTVGLTKWGRDAGETDLFILSLFAAVVTFSLKHSVTQTAAPETVASIWDACSPPVEQRLSENQGYVSCFTG